MKTTTKVKLNNQAREELLRAAILLGGNCPHPREHVLGMFPATTSGKEVCLLCKMSRTQLGKGGPWRQWKQQ